MKEYFARLFDYDTHVNLQIAGLIKTSNHPPKVIELMSHLLSAQQIWLSRCTVMPFDNYQLWPKWDIDTFTDIIETNKKDWANFLQSETDIYRNVAYKNSKGEKFSASLTDILAHVINHGTHHRAQIGLLLKQSTGIELPFTDYIYFALSNI